MTTIVQHKRTGNEYILLGINGIDRKPNLSPRSIGDLFSQDNDMSSALMAVCDVRGNIFLVDMEDLIVMEIDGQKPSAMLPEIPAPAVNTQYNPDTASDFDDDDDFEDALEPESKAQVSSTYNQTSSPTEDLDDDEDWI